MSKFSDLGNDLYTGKRSVEFVGRTRTWLVISVVLFLIAMGGLFIRQLNLGIEFTGGSDFRIAAVSDLDNYEARTKDVINQAGGVGTAQVTRVGGDTIRVTTERFEDDKAQTVKDALAKEFSVTLDQVQFSVIGPSWGASVSQKALQALIWFLLLVALVLAIYFRSWKMSFAALVALFHDIFITVGIYSLAGLEVTPASMIGFLTILGYSLYDTVVVFDKVRENTDEARRTGGSTFSRAANLAVNQTLVRSINTTVVALLPITALLLVGVFVLGPGTLLDLSVALFIGVTVGAYSSIFIATPLYAQLREREPEMQQLAARAAKLQAKAERRAAAAANQRTAVPASAGAGGAREPGPTEAAGAVSDGETGAVLVGEGRRDADHGSPASAAGATALPSGDSTYVDDAGVERTLTGRPVHPYAKRGPRNQPKRPPKSKR